MLMEAIGKEFRVKKAYRIIISTIAMLFCLALLRDAYIYFAAGINSSSFQVNVILIGCTLVLAFIALKANFSIFRIVDNEIVISSFLRKDKHYPISKIEFVEFLSDRFSVIKIYFSNEEKITMMPIENENEFIEILNERLKVLGKTWSFMKK